MKVLHVIPSLGPLRGGPSFVLRTMAKGLAGHGIEVSVVTTDDNGAQRLDVPLGKPVLEDGVTYRYFPRQTRPYICSLPLTAWLQHHIGTYDLAHIHAVFSYCSNAAAWIAHLHRIPYVIRPLGVLNRWGMQNRRPWLKQLSFHFIEKHLLHRAALIHYTSEQERMEAEEAGVVDKAKVIPNPVEIPEISREEAARAFRTRYPDLAGRKLILFLSRIDRKKGLNLLLPAFADVLARQPQAVLVVAGAGDPSFVGSLKENARRLGLGESVLWTGHLTGHEKWSALCAAGVFVLPSYSENFGIAAVEAMGLGLPVLITDQVAIHREVSRAEAGLVVPCETAALAVALDRLLSHRELRRRLGGNGERLARSSFSLTAATQQLVDVYGELTQSNGRYQ